MKNWKTVWTLLLNIFNNMKISEWMSFVFCRFGTQTLIHYTQEGAANVQEN